MEIKRSGLERNDISCKFISVKYTGEETPFSTQPRKQDWVPVVRVFARCHAQGGIVKIRITFRYQKGGVLLLPNPVNFY